MLVSTSAGAASTCKPRSKDIIRAHYGMGSALLAFREELGEFAGLSRQRTNAAIKALEKANLVQASYGSLLIRDLRPLRNFARGGS